MQRREALPCPQAYARRDFADAVANLNKLVEMVPQDPKWREMRAQVGFWLGRL